MLSEAFTMPRRKKCLDAVIVKKKSNILNIEIIVGDFLSGFEGGSKGLGRTEDRRPETCFPSFPHSFFEYIIFKFKKKI